MEFAFVRSVQFESYGKSGCFTNWLTTNQSWNRSLIQTLVKKKKKINENTWGCQLRRLKLKAACFRFDLESNLLEGGPVRVPGGPVESRCALLFLQQEAGGACRVTLAVPETSVEKSSTVTICKYLKCENRAEINYNFVEYLKTYENCESRAFKPAKFVLHILPSEKV